MYAKGALVAENLVTGDDGSVSLSKLYPGEYQVVEVKAPEKFVTASEPKNVTVTAGASNAETVFATVTYTNDRQKADVTVIKTDNETKVPLAGGIYATYAGEDIVNADGQTIVKKDTLIEKVTTSAEGNAKFQADLPCGFAYYMKEVQAPENYLNAKIKLIKKDAETGTAQGDAT